MLFKCPGKRRGLGSDEGPDAPGLRGTLHVGNAAVGDQNKALRDRRRGVQTRFKEPVNSLAPTLAPGQESKAKKAIEATPADTS